MVQEELVEIHMEDLVDLDPTAEAAVAVALVQMEILEMLETQGLQEILDLPETLDLEQTQDLMELQ